MARVRVLRTYPAGDRVQVTLDVENDYPDCLSSAITEALRGFREACALAEAPE